MPIHHGNGNRTAAAYLGTTALSRIYHGETLVFDADAVVTPPSTDVWGALVASATGTRSLTLNVPIPWDLELLDPGAWHSTTTNTDRITIPEAGLYRAIFNTNGGEQVEYRIQKNGADVPGITRQRSDTSTGFEYTNAATAIISCTGGDYFTLVPANTSDVNESATWFAVEKVPSDRAYAIASKSASQAIAAGTTTSIVWGAEIVDAGGRHSTSSNTDRLTTISGDAYARVSASLRIDNKLTASQAQISAFKNGAAFRGMFSADAADPQTTTHISGVSAIVPVTGGTDYFTANAFTTDATDLPASDRSWFQIEIIPSTHKFATAYPTSNTTLTPADTWVTVNLGGELADTAGAYTSGNNIVAPSGVNKARATFNIKTPSTTGQIMGRVVRNGSYQNGLPMVDTDTAGTDNLNGFGMWIDCAPGDTFSLQAYSETVQTLSSADNETWLCVEFTSGASGTTPGDDPEITPALHSMWVGALS